jgi:uncharacterized metal-binding protein YceD (DUF177 family)
MQEKLEIDMAHLPEEGKAFSGVLDPKVFGLSENDAKPVGGLEYDLYAQQFDDELLLRGYLAAPFEFTCVRTNNLFIQTISLEDAAISLEVDSSIMDVTEAIREEVLINFPAYPRCDQADEPMECKIDERYLVLDKTIEDSVCDAPPSENTDQWSALDGFNQFKDNQ